MRCVAGLKKGVVGIEVAMALIAFVLVANASAFVVVNANKNRKYVELVAIPIKLIAQQVWD